MTARFMALYETPANPTAFDRHYQDVHIPLARQLPGLRRYTLGRDVVAVRGGEPYYLVAESYVPLTSTGTEKAAVIPAAPSAGSIPVIRSKEKA